MRDRRAVGGPAGAGVNKARGLNSTWYRQRHYFAMANMWKPELDALLAAGESSELQCRWVRPSRCPLLLLFRGTAVERQRTNVLRLQKVVANAEIDLCARATCSRADGELQLLRGGEKGEAHPGCHAGKVEQPSSAVVRPFVPTMYVRVRSETWDATKPAPVVPMRGVEQGACPIC
jgi:hypothetical protein